MFIFLAAYLLFLIKYINSPLTTFSANRINNREYRIICHSEWASKVMYISIFISPFELQDSDIIFDVLNQRKANNVSLKLCPSLNKLDSLLKCYKEFEIEIYKKNITNVEEEPPDYYYKLTKYDLVRCDSLTFTKDCFMLERIK